MGASDSLCTPISEIDAEYDVVVVGSGYGGAITACRLARAGRSVCVLERGDELRPGDYPERLGSAARHAQAQVGTRHFGFRDSLFDFRVGRDISVLVGCGVGGTSLINANVALEADPRIFADPRWPAPLRGLGNPLATEYALAAAMLGSHSYSTALPTPAKVSALGRAAAALHHPLERPPINVTLPGAASGSASHQGPCTGCGNCVTGCNDGAKNTLIMNYLPDAHANGAQIFPGAEVWTVEPMADGRWRILFNTVRQGRERYRAPTQFVIAQVVVLAAGTLGSSGILLRSARSGLSVSNQVGARFSGNGDVIGFAFDSDQPVNGVGQLERGALDANSPGPCITGLIDLRNTPAVNDGLVIEDAVLPSALAGVMAVGLPVAAAAAGGRRSRTRRLLEGVRGMLEGARSGALVRTLTLLVMSSDDADGRLVLDGDTVAVEWPEVGSRPVYRHDNHKLRDASKAIDATWIRNPFSTKQFDHSLVTVHPLGGCVMADRAEDGVVDHEGAVFSGPTGSGTHKGLYVADGSIIPRALGVNPLLTISALAERSSALLVSNFPWGSAGQVAGGPAPGGDGMSSTTGRAPTRPGLRFTERMSGFFSTKVGTDCDAGYRQGRADGTEIEYVVTIDVDDIEKLIKDPSTKARLSGTVTAPALTAERLTVANGWFQLFDPDLDHVETSLMRYHLPLIAEDGRRFTMDGHKTIHYGSLLDAWPATTSLDATIRAADGTPVGAGVLHMSVEDLARMLTTMRVPRARNRLDACRRLGRFYRRFAAELVERYGGILSESHSWDETDTSIVRRQVRLPDPTCRYYNASGTWHDQPDAETSLRLTWYRQVGDSKGPVMLAPGFGMSTAAFVTDTIATNLAEYLFEHGYDVWLLDFRWSPDLPSSRTSFDIDEVATVDWPEAVREVRRLNEAEDVQVIAHCVGSMSFLMAMLAGMTGVRSAICSQVTVHPRMTWFHRLLVGVHTSQALQAVGYRTITPDAKRSFADEALDVLLRLTPTKRQDRCASAVCRWINTFYGPTHYHAQLNQSTHNDIARLFGVADLDALDHIGLIVNKGKAVDRRGRDVYLPHVDRLRIPILFLAGDQNRIFLPSTSRHTYNWLVKANGPQLYKRAILHDYAHLDGFIGRDASQDVYPLMREHLEAHASPRAGTQPAPALQSP